MMNGSMHLRQRIARRRLLLALLGGAIGFEIASRSASAQADDYSGKTGPPLLIGPATLQAMLADEPNAPVVLDLSDILDFGQEHIPTARHAWWQDTIDPEYPVYGAVLTQGEDQLFRQRVFDSWRIQNDQPVVVHDNARGRHAARVVWFLRFLGIDNASMLEGGLTAWKEAGGGTTNQLHKPDNGPTPAVAPSEGFYIVTSQLVDRFDDRDTIIVDTRTSEEASDDVRGTVPLGRIPGSRVLPWTDTLRDGAGRLLPPESMEALLVERGIVPDRRVVVYARYGVEAAHTWLVLKLMGYEDVIVYDRGWVEWATTPGLPIDPLS
jgi:thiosulfate/3-mercaptopyruvate sulfurtransferase